VNTKLLGVLLVGLFCVLVTVSCRGQADKKTVEPGWVSCRILYDITTQPYSLDTGRPLQLKDGTRVTAWIMDYYTDPQYKGRRPLDDNPRRLPWIQEQMWRLMPDDIVDRTPLWRTVRSDLQQNQVFVKQVVFIDRPPSPPDSGRYGL
jgi:hypothetical protein